MVVPLDAVLWAGIPNVSLLILYIWLALMDNAPRRGNHFLAMHVAAMVPVASIHCRLWYTWRLVASQIMLASVETTLILRGR